GLLVAITLAVGDQDVARTVHRDAGRPGELGPGRRPAVARGAQLAVARDGVDVPGPHADAVEPSGPGRDDLDPRAVLALDRDRAHVREHDVARAVDRDPGDHADPGAGGRAAVAAVPAAAARDRVNVVGRHLLAVEGAAARRDDPDVTGVAVAQHDVAGMINPQHRPRLRQVDLAVALGSQGQVGGRGGTPVARVPVVPRARDRVDVPGRHGLAVEAAGLDRDDPYPVVAGIGEHDVARRVHPHAARPAQLGRRRRAAVAGEPLRAFA